MATKEQWDEVRAERPYPLAWTLLEKIISLHSQLQLQMKSEQVTETRQCVQVQIVLLESLITFADQKCGIRIGESSKP